MSASGHRHRCPKCGKDRAFSYRWDAYYCEKCKVWLEEKCADALCIFCADRPAEPPRTEHCNSTRSKLS